MTHRHAPVVDPYIAWLGVTYDSMEGGQCQVSLVPRPEHFNPHHALSGGVIYSMIDHAMGAALWTLNADDHFATIAITINYLSAVREAMRVVGSVRVVEKKSRIAYLEGEVRTADGVLVARASGTFYIIASRK